MFCVVLSICHYIRTDIFPDCLKLARVTPIPKGGDSTNKGKVFYGQEPPSGESTTTESGVNYQLLAVY